LLFLLCFNQLIGLALGDSYCNSEGSTTSESYTIKNGVKLVNLLGNVHKLQSTEGSSTVHFSSQAKTS
jgi:hypothetical protein